MTEVFNYSGVTEGLEGQLSFNALCFLQKSILLCPLGDFSSLDIITGS